MARSQVLAEMSEADLIAALDEAKDDLLNLRFQNVTGQLDNHSRLGQVRRDIARLMTELREREIEAAEAADDEETN